MGFYVALHHSTGCIFYEKLQTFVIAFYFICNKGKTDWKYTGALSLNFKTNNVMCSNIIFSINSRMIGIAGQVIFLSGRARAGFYILVVALKNARSIYLVTYATEYDFSCIKWN